MPTEADQPLEAPGPRGRSAWLELMRISNLPTVLSNVLVGCAVGEVLALGGPDRAWGFPWARAAMLACSMGLLYLAGMALNDVCDVERDRRERPQRPIPSGRISRPTALLFGVLCLLGGLAILLFLGRAPFLLGIGLGALIVAYDLVHRRAAWAILLMGACRGMIYVIAAQAVWPRLGLDLWILDCSLPFALALALYTVAISLVARHEAGRPRRIAIVSWMLAGISVLDLIILLVLGQRLPAAAAGMCFVATLAAQRFVAGT